MRRSTIESLEARAMLAVDFSLAAFSDTQYSVETFPATFARQTAWIAAHKTDPNYNFAFFAQQGDMLRRGYSDYQAGNAAAALNTLDAARLPYAVAIGNHDYDNQFDDLDHHVSSANFARWFGDARYAPQLAAGSISEYGSSLDQRNHYRVFTAGGQKFMVISLEWQVPVATQAWAQGVINAHRQLPAIVITHEYLAGSMGNRTTGTPVDASALGAQNGQSIYTNFVAANPQVFMVLSGHTGATWNRVVTNDVGSRLFEVAADFESSQPNGGDGWMQTLQFTLADPGSGLGSLTITNVRPGDGTVGDQFGASTTYSDINFAERFNFAPTGAPIANNDMLNTAVDQAAPFTFDVRPNDFDPDGAVDGTYTVVPGTLPASIVQNPNGTFTYTPVAGFRGNLSFGYSLIDPTTQESNPATATLRVNAAPVARADALSTWESRPLTINVLANDSDDGDQGTLKSILTALPEHGAVFANSDGTFAYTPDPKFVGTDTFTYVSSDGKTVSAPAVVSVTVHSGPVVYSYPTAETTNVGVRTGSLANVTASDQVVETISETISTGTDVDHRWTFSLPRGTDQMLCLNAWRSFSNPGTGDEYHLKYSTNGSTWTDLTRLVPNSSKDVTRTRSDAGQPYQMWALPATLFGTVYIQATDVNTSGTETVDTLTVDEVFIRTLPEDAVAPSVVSSTFLYAANPNRFEVRFSENVAASLDIGDLRVVPLPSGNPIASASVSFDPLTCLAAFTFASRLPDGNYRATVLAGGVTDPVGHPLAADHSFDVFFLNGDANRDRTVGFDDLLLLAQNYNGTGRTWATADFTGDGKVDFDDLLILAQNYNVTLPALPVTELAAAEASPAGPKAAVATSTTLSTSANVTTMPPAVAMSASVDDVVGNPAASPPDPAVILAVPAPTDAVITTAAPATPIPAPATAPSIPRSTFASTTKVAPATIARSRRPVATPPALRAAPPADRAPATGVPLPQRFTFGDKPIRRKDDLLG